MRDARQEAKARLLDALESVFSGSDAERVADAIDDYVDERLREERADLEDKIAGRGIYDPDY